MNWNEAGQINTENTVKLAAKKQRNWELNI